MVDPLLQLRSHHAHDAEQLAQDAANRTRPQKPKAPLLYACWGAALTISQTHSYMSTLKIVVSVIWV